MTQLVEDSKELERKLVESLTRMGKLDAGGLARVERLRDEANGSLPSLLARLGLVSERDLAAALAEAVGGPLVSDADLPSEPVLPERLGARFLRQKRVLPLANGDSGLLLAVADPLDRSTIDAVRIAVGSDPQIRVAEAGFIEHAIERLYARDAAVAEGVEGESGEGLELDVERLKDLASEAPVVRLVNGFITRAVETRASDIHIEPFEANLRVRYRIDGVLIEGEAQSLRLAPAVISRIKIMAKLNIAERRLPQDGRIQVVVRGKTVDLRVATMPTLHGEAVVLRILDRDAVALDFAALGVGAANQASLTEMLKRPNGVFLVTGPTGSGKTTTLYAGLTLLNSPDKKILTVEDPIEYRLEGINQVQIKPGIGLSFAHVLRSMLRHDPDIIMVGEIRDGETAEIAVQAALTGHLVLSTLHTNDAAGSITRLIDMGVKDYLLTSTLTGVVGQRLVRTLCPHCREAEPALPEVSEQLGLRQLQPTGEILLYRAKGCDACGGRGFQGRTAVIEILMMNEHMRQLVLRKAEAQEIFKAAVENGMRPMFEDGLLKVLAGVTTLEEVYRVTREV